MKAVVQRVRAARVEVEGAVVGAIEAGLAVFVGIESSDTAENMAKMAHKLVNLRVFSDEAGRFQHSVKEVAGQILLVSNFTVCGDARKGNRPNFMAAAPPETAEAFYERLATLLRDQGVVVAMGSFGADMRVFVENDGPVSLILEF